MPEHSMQPLVQDEDGRIMFQTNRIVQFLLDAGPFDLNQLWQMPWSIEDMEQFYQLIGCSVNGFGEISRFRKETVAAVDQQVALEFPGEEE